MLDTFYGAATMHGMKEEEYFEKMGATNIENEQATRDYFRTNMEAIKVKENTVFILVDQWWRGIDSRSFGLLEVSLIDGVVVGYEDQVD